VSFRHFRRDSFEIHLVGTVSTRYRAISIFFTRDERDVAFYVSSTLLRTCRSFIVLNDNTPVIDNAYERPFVMMQDYVWHRVNRIVARRSIGSVTQRHKYGSIYSSLYSLVSIPLAFYSACVCLRLLDVEFPFGNRAVGPLIERSLILIETESYAMGIQRLLSRVFIVDKDRIHDSIPRDSRLYIYIYKFTHSCHACVSSSGIGEFFNCHPEMRRAK